MATLSFEEGRFYNLSLEPLKPPQEQSNHTTTTMNSVMAMLSFEEARFYSLTNSMDSHMASPSFGEARFYGSATTMDSHMATTSFEEARFYGLSLEPLTLNPPQEHSNPQENKCMCSSPSNHPSVLSSRHTSNNMVLLKTAMKNSMLKMGGEKTKSAKKEFIKSVPQSLLRHHGEAFQVRPSRLGPFAPVPPQCRVQ